MPHLSSALPLLIAALVLFSSMASAGPLTYAACQAACAAGTLTFLPLYAACQAACAALLAAPSP